MDDPNSCWLIVLPPAGWEWLAQDCDQCLQGRKWQHIQPGSGGGLHVWRPNRPQDLPVETTTHCKNHVFLSWTKGTLLRCNVEKGIFFFLEVWSRGSHCSAGMNPDLYHFEVCRLLNSLKLEGNMSIQFICANKMNGCILNSFCTLEGCKKSFSLH